MKFRKPPLRIQPTTLWDYSSQHYGDTVQGDPNFPGATPSYIIWNLLQRYTKEKDLIIDPCAGSGTTLDVARDLNRRALGYDVHPTRKDIFRVDARKLPPELTAKADFVFIDPPYSTHLDYGPDPRDIGKLSAAGKEYYLAMEQVIAEIHRVLKSGRHMALYVGDSYQHEKTSGRFFPIGFELFSRLRQIFTPIDTIAVVRHNKTLEQGNYRRAAEEGNFYLRGFNYLFIMRKVQRPPRARSAGLFVKPAYFITRDSCPNSSICPSNIPKSTHQIPLATVIASVPPSGENAISFNCPVGPYPRS